MIELIFDVSGTTRYGATVHHADALTTDWLKQMGAWAHGTDYYLHLRIADETDIQGYVDAHITPQLRAHMHSVSLYLNPYNATFASCILTICSPPRSGTRSARSGAWRWRSLRIRAATRWRITTTWCRSLLAFFDRRRPALQWHAGAHGQKQLRRYMPAPQEPTDHQLPHRELPAQRAQLVVLGARLP